LNLCLNYTVFRELKVCGVRVGVYQPSHWHASPGCAVEWYTSMGSKSNNGVENLPVVIVIMWG